MWWKALRFSRFGAFTISAIVHHSIRTFPFSKDGFTVVVCLLYYVLRINTYKPRTECTELIASAIFAWFSVENLTCVLYTRIVPIDRAGWNGLVG